MSLSRENVINKSFTKTYINKILSMNQRRRQFSQISRYVELNSIYFDISNIKNHLQNMYLYFEHKVFKYIERHTSNIYIYRTYIEYLYIPNIYRIFRYFEHNVIDFLKVQSKYN